MVDDHCCYFMIHHEVLFHASSSDSTNLGSWELLSAKSHTPIAWFFANPAGDFGRPQVAVEERRPLRQVHLDKTFSRGWGNACLGQLRAIAASCGTAFKQRMTSRGEGLHKFELRSGLHGGIASQSCQLSSMRLTNVRLLFQCSSD